MGIPTEIELEKELEKYNELVLEINELVKTAQEKDQERLKWLGKLQYMKAVIDSVEKGRVETPPAKKKNKRQ